MAQSSDQPASRRQQGIQSVEVGMRVLEAIEAHGGPASLSEVAAASGMPANKAHRYLVSLGRAGFVAQDRLNGVYDLGPAARRLGVEALRRNDEVSIASARVMALRDETGHTINLSVWSESGPTIVRWDTGRHALSITFRVGSVLPLLESSVGRVFLAYLPRAQTRAVLAQQQRRQETGGMPAAKVNAIAEQVSQAGFAYTTAALVPGLAALAAPVLAVDRELLMVVGLALPARLARGRTLSRLSDELTAAVDEISASLGQIPDDFPGVG
jgi:DNA-binding IclR family transcriptional regulator